MLYGAIILCAITGVIIIIIMHLSVKADFDKEIKSSAEIIRELELRNKYLAKELSETKLMVIKQLN